MPISDKTYRLLLSSGITAGGVGLAWMFMKAITPSREEMLKVFCPVVDKTLTRVHGLPKWMD